MTPTQPAPLDDAGAMAHKPKGHGLMCVIFATDLYAALAKDGYTLPTNGSFGPATSEFIRAHITDYMRAEAELAAVREKAAGERAVQAFCETVEGLGAELSGTGLQNNIIAAGIRAAIDAARGEGG